jgi:hypothetical protein
MRVPNSVVKLLCSLEGGKSQIDAGQARDLVHKMAVIEAMSGWGDEGIHDKCNAAYNELTTYTNALADKVSSLKDKEAPPDEILQKLLGRKAQGKKRK